MQESLLGFEKGNNKVIEIELLLPYDFYEEESKIVVANKRMELKPISNLKKKTLEWVVLSELKYDYMDEVIFDENAFTKKEDAEEWMEGERDWDEFSRKNYLIIGQKYWYRFEVKDGKFKWGKRVMIFEDKITDF